MLSDHLLLRLTRTQQADTNEGRAGGRPSENSTMLKIDKAVRRLLGQERTNLYELDCTTTSRRFDSAESHDLESD